MMTGGVTGLLDLSIAEAAKLVERKEISPVELVDASLDRIAATNAALKAFIAVYAEQARAAARAFETLARVGHLIGPLHGIPIALKDNISVKGLTTTAGSRVLSEWVPDEDATVTARLKGAGAIIVGKTNMHEFAWGGTTDNPHYGTCRNPWDKSRFTAGSSGGSGVAIAVRAAYGALGTDTGGSIRLPSAINGIVGIQPTIGRVSNAGVIPLAWTMDTVGPMTSSVRDCALMFNAVAGFDPRDPGSAVEPIMDYTADLGLGIRGLRIGVVPDYFFSHLQPAVERSVRDALAVFEGLGASVNDVRIEHIHGNISAQLTVESGEPSTYHQRWLREDPTRYGGDVRSLLEIGELLPATAYLQAQRYRQLLRGEFLRAFKLVDVFVCPTLPFTATPAGATTVVIDGEPEVMLSASCNIPASRV